MILAFLVIAVVIFFLKAYLMMLTWGMVVDNVELFSGLSTLSYEGALYVALFVMVTFAFTFSGSNSSGD